MLTFILLQFFIFSIQILLLSTTILSLSPGLSFIPSLIGLGNANPTEFPHLTRVASNVTIVNEILFQPSHMLLFTTLINT